MFMIKKLVLVAAALSAVLFLSTSAQAQELQCDNGIDDDGDTVYDCGDGDWNPGRGVGMTGFAQIRGNDMGGRFARGDGAIMTGNTGVGGGDGVIERGH